MASRQPDFARLLAAIAREAKGRGLPFMMVGGQAVLLHGAPRLTHDIDLTLGVGPDDIQGTLDMCQALGLRVLARDPVQFARETFVCPAVDEATSARVDFIFSATSYEAAAIGRAVEVVVAGERVPFASAEDLILLKLFSGRQRDMEDARSVVARQAALDWRYLEHWGREFAVVEGREQLPELIRDLRTTRPPTPPPNRSG